MNSHPVSITESHSVCSHIFFYGGCPVLWKRHKEALINQSSCKAEIKSTDECVKNDQMFRNILSDLHLLSVSSNIYFQYVHRAFDWSHSFSTKGMHHLYLRVSDNVVCEA
jgi:hypothetical protein